MRGRAKGRRCTPSTQRPAPSCGRWPFPSAGYRCYRTNLTFSIGETPAIDRGKNLLYFGDGHNQVHAVDLATGKEAYGWPVTIADYTPDHNFMHGGLTYNPANGLLYAVTGSTCDLTPWYGRIVAINTSVPSIAGSFFTMSGTAIGRCQRRRHMGAGRRIHRPGHQQRVCCDGECGYE